MQNAIAVLTPSIKTFNKIALIGKKYPHYQHLLEYKPDERFRSAQGF